MSFFLWHALLFLLQMNTATLELKLNGEDISIQFPVDSMDGYRQAAEVIKAYREVAKQASSSRRTYLRTSRQRYSTRASHSWKRLAMPCIAIRDEAYNNTSQDG